MGQIFHIAYLPYEQEARLGFGRLYLILAGIGIVLFELIRPGIYPGLPIHLWDQWLNAGLCLLVLMSSYSSRIHPRVRQQIIDTWMSLYTLHALLILYEYDFFHYYVVLNVVVVQAIFLLQRSHRALTHYFLLVMGSLGLLLAISPHATAAQATYLLATFVVICTVNYAGGILRLQAQYKAHQRKGDLTKSEERYARAVLGANDGLWDWDLDTNELFLTPRFWEMLGYGKHDVPPHIEAWYALIHPDDQALVLQRVKEHLKGQTDQLHGEFRMRHRDGTYRWILSRGKATRDANGWALRLTGHHTDITQRKQTERTLQGVLNSSLNGIMAFQAIRNASGKVIDFVWTLANQTAEHMVGLPADALIGQRLLEVMPGNRVEGLFEAYVAVVETGQSLDIEHYYDHEHVHKTWFHTVAVKMGDGFAVTFSNITERKRSELELQQAKEVAEQAAQTKAEFLANMSHEIRTPMNAVIGMTSLLLQTSPSPEQQQYIETIRISGENLLTIINDVLDFSKIESGKLELEQQPFHLRDLLEGVLDLMAPKAAERQLELMLYLDPQLPSHAVADPTRLSQVLVNLIGNALKFTEVGEVSVHVRARNPSAPEDGFLYVEVRDTGIGIPRDKLQRLFRSFSQVDASITRKYGGTGLGLIISKKLVNLMGGRIWIESELGRGTSFFFTIEARCFSEHVPSPDLSPLAGKRVRLVEPHAGLRAELSDFFRSWGLVPDPVPFNPLKDVLTPSALLEETELLVINKSLLDPWHLSRGCMDHPISPKPPILLISPLGEGLPSPLPPCFSAQISKPVHKQQLLEQLLALFSPRLRPRQMDMPPSSKPLPLAQRIPLNILLVEDNLVNQKVAVRMLEKLGYQADIAGNGLEALKALELKRYDLLFMDMQMPEMDGLQATHAIRQQPQLQAHPPTIIAMTANAMKGDRERCLEAGMDDYISKPIKLEKVSGVIETWFSSRLSSPQA